MIKYRLREKKIFQMKKKNRFSHISIILKHIDTNHANQFTRFFSPAKTLYYPLIFKLKVYSK